MLKRFHGWWSANGQTNWFVVLCTLTLTPTPKPTKNSTDQTSFPQDFQLLLPQIHQKRRCYLLSFLTGNWFSDKLFSSVSHEFGHRAAQQVGLLFQKNQSKIWFNKGMMIRINYGGTFWDVFFFPKLVWRRTEMSVLVIMLLHANNIIFVGFWPNHFAGNGVLSVYTTTDRIFQDVAFFLLVVVPLTNPHPLTLYYPKMLVSSWSVLSCAQRQERPINPVTQCSHRNLQLRLLSWPENYKGNKNLNS